ncbi:MAG: SpoIIE family protein phosphatase [Anaerolineales bacterium]|nr:SpoIIE family protein phosphatase [Chloroflexota bacterium]MBK6646231.1 SpoIIE family protein phosphatase [Anaerolineales bacterium]
MLPTITDKHRENFKSLSSGWMRVGATCVQLRRGGEVLVGCPDSKPGSEPSIAVTSLASGLSLHVFGIADARWVPTAESMLEIFGSLLSADADLENLTGALVETQDRLVALYELTQATRRTLDMPKLLDLLIQQSRHLMDVDGGFVVLKEKGRQTIIHQVSEKPLHPAHAEAAASLYLRDPNRHVFKDSETLPADLKNVMMVTLPVRDEISAAVGLFNKTGNFTTPDIKLAKAIAGHIGAQMENAMLHKEAVERARLETEMDIARQVQTAILPQSIPQVKGVDVFATSTPALEVGGDFFDVIDRSENTLVFALGDVTGKGMPAALLMSMTHTIIKSASRNMPFTQPHQVLNRLNHDMAADFANVGMFTTVMLGMIDCADCKLHFSNAGQSPIYHVPFNSEPMLLEAQDIPVGILDTVEYTTQSLNLSQGDLFIAASDGFPESRNPAGEMYGYERMRAILSSSRTLSAKQIAEVLLADVNAFCGAHPQDDDRTIVVLKFEKSTENRIMFNESLTVRANYEEIRQPCERLRLNLRQAGVSEEIAGQCELALQELLTNLVDHAYEGNPNGQVAVRMAGNRGQIFIQTEDTGAPANIKLEDVHMPAPEDLAEGGYGMAIIRSLMDDIRYETAQEKNVWTLVKNL